MSFQLGGQLAACLFFGCASMASSGVLAAGPLPPIDNAVAATSAAAWRSLGRASSPCKYAAPPAGLKRIVQHFGGVDISVFLNRKTKSLQWACISVADDPARVIEQGDLGLLFRVFEATNRDTLFAVRQGPRHARIFHVEGEQVQYFDLFGPLGFESINSLSAEGASVITADDSGRGGGIYSAPLAHKGEDVAPPLAVTHWINADTYRLDAQGLKGWTICNGLPIWNSKTWDDETSPGPGAPTLSCTFSPHDDWSEFRFRPPSAAKGGMLLVHGGPVRDFHLNERFYTFAYAYAGYALDAVNYVDADPVPTGAAARRQVDRAQTQILNAWSTLYRETGAPPKVLAESLGFLMIGKILEQPGPLTIIAVSPVSSGKSFLALQRRQAMTVGVPGANWPRLVSVVDAAPDVGRMICRRADPTSVIVVASRKDPVFGADGRRLIRSLADCPRVTVTYRELDGDAHATGELYQNALALDSGDEAAGIMRAFPYLHSAPAPAATPR